MQWLWLSFIFIRNDIRFLWFRTEINKPRKEKIETKKNQIFLVCIFFIVRSDKLFKDCGLHMFNEKCLISFLPYLFPYLDPYNCSLIYHLFLMISIRYFQIKIIHDLKFSRMLLKMRPQSKTQPKVIRRSFRKVIWVQTTTIRSKTIE